MLCRSVLTALLMATLSGFATADVAPDRGFESKEVPPKEPPPLQVAMRAEEVTLTLGPQELQVEGVFHMLNTGKKAAKLLVTFPAGDRKDALQDFHAALEGKSLRTDLVDKGADRTRNYHYRFEANFPAGKETTLTVRYRTAVHGKAEYILHTGAGWAGVIGKAMVSLKLAGGLTPADLKEIQPAGFKADATGGTWIFEHLEPTEKDDIRIAYAVPTPAP